MGFPMVVALLFALNGAADDTSGFRTWTSDEGRTLKAALAHVEGDEITLELPSGREAILSIDRLSEVDREFLKRTTRRGGGKRIEPLPPETAPLETVEVGGGPRVFRSKHFEFRNERDVSPAFVSEAAGIYEGTLAALQAIPHGLKLNPPRGNTRFGGRFLDEARFSGIAEERMGSLPGQRIVGLYLSDRQELLVPYSALGARQLGSRMTLRKSSDTSTLVHEIVHQVMHQWLPVLPTWYSEGLAEYVASIPNQNGRFMFKYAERGLRTRLEERYEISGRVITGVRRPSQYFLGLGHAESSLTRARSAREGERAAAGSVLPRSGGGAEPLPSGLDPWGGTILEYRDALLFLYFFMHLDEPERPGERVGQYMRAVDIALGETEFIREEVSSFEERRIVYNEAVRAYNRELGEFRKQVDLYNEKVVRYNEQVKAGIPFEARTRVGEIPKLPVAPDRPKMPESIRILIDERRSINLVHFVQSRSLPVLLSGRSQAALDARLRNAYAEIGWEIRYR